jgi:uncharacterized membrane protein YfcA
MSLVIIILILLAVALILTLVLLIKDFISHRQDLGTASWIKSGGIGFVTNFLDVLGIGSFAPTTAGLRLFKQMEDRIIPGTLNIGCCIPVIVEALLFINKVEVEPITLGGMLAASAVGAWVGAGIVSKLPVQPIRLIMGVALFLAAFLMLASKMGWMPSGGEATGLTGVLLVIAIGINFILGALMCFGIGLYAPCMALVYIMGMSPLVAFPIMMGSCAFLMPTATIRFIKDGAYSRRAAMAITIGGSAGVFIAYYIVKSMPLEVLRWLVMAVLTYTSITLLVSFFKTRKAAI